MELKERQRMISTAKIPKVGIILVLLVAVSLFHFLTGTLDHDLHVWHLFFRKLFFVPIIAAAVWFGLSGALLPTWAWRMKIAGIFFWPESFTISEKSASAMTSSSSTTA